MNTREKKTPGRRWLRHGGRAVAVLWALFWTWFGLASGIHEKLALGGIILHTAIPGGVFLLSAALPFIRERSGAIVLMGEGLLIAAAYPLWAAHRFPPDALPRLLFFMLLTLALPPILAGSLTLAEKQTPAFLKGRAPGGCMG